MQPVLQCLFRLLEIKVAAWIPFTCSYSVKLNHAYSVLTGFLETVMKHIREEIMSKVIVPQPNAKELKAFDMAGIRMRTSMTEEEFIAMAVTYLSTHNVLHLATCKDNEPRCTPVEYFNNGLIVYMFCEGGGKIANMKVQEKVSYSIADPYNPGVDFFGASGMQVWGVASVFKKNEDIESFREVRKYSRYMKQLV